MRPILGAPIATGPVPIVIGAVAAFVLFRLLRKGRPFRVALLFAASLGFITASGMAAGIEHRVGSSFPHSFFLWAALPVFAATATVHARRRETEHAIGWGVACVVLFTAFGAAEVNAHYDYLPTVGDVVGAPLHDQVSPDREEQPAVTTAIDAAPLAALGAYDASDVRNRGQGVMLRVRVPATVSRFPARPAWIYLPPAYLADPSAPLPVVVMLAGVPGNPADMARAAGATGLADAYAARHGGRAPILVFPDHNGGFFGDTECVDGPRGLAETYLTVDVPAFVHAAVPSSAASWGIVGYSEGGTCAVVLSLRHPALFANFVDIAGDPAPNAASGPKADRLTVARLYGHDEQAWRAHDPARLLRARAATGTAGWFVAGRADRRPLRTARALAGAARAAGLDAHLVELRGGHNFSTVHRSLVRTFPSLADRLFAQLPVTPGTDAKMPGWTPSTPTA